MAAPRKWRQLLELLAGLKIPLNAALGKVLTSDVEGNATWAFPGELNVAMAYRSAEQKIPNTTFTRIKVDKVLNDPGANMNVAAGNGWYTVPADGYYQISGSISLQMGATEATGIASVFLSGAEVLRSSRQTSTTASAIFTLGVAGIVFCKKGEKIELFTWQSSGAERVIETGPTFPLCVTRVGEGPPGPENKLVEESISMAFRNAVQKIPNGVFTQLKLDKVIKDAGSHFNASGSYVVPADGYYQVNGNSLLKTTVAAEYNAVLKVYVNGSPAVAGVFLEKVGKEFIGGTVAGIVFCKAGETIELMVYQASGAERETFNSQEFNQMSVARIGTGPTGATGPEGKSGEFTALESVNAKLENGKAVGPLSAPSARTEGGGTVVRMIGSYAVKAANTLTGNVAIATLPVGMRPGKARRVNVTCSNEASEYTQIGLSIATTGVITVSSLALTGVNKMKAENEIYLEGATFPI